MKESFPPIFESDARVLILGSMPGEISLARREYYAHPRNQFWRLMEVVFGIPAQAAYSDRVLGLKKNGVALWDVLESCERVGSLDSAIRNAVPNDFEGLLASLPDLGIIAFNGKRASQWFERWVKVEMRGVQKICLPSSSPAATLGFEKKVAAWKRLREG